MWIKTTTENLETVKRLYESFAEDDTEAKRDIMAPDVELHEPKGITGGGMHHGFDEATRTSGPS